MSFFLTKEVADKAIDLVTPLIEAGMKDGTFNRPHLHIIVFDPTRSYSTEHDRPVLTSRSFGRPSEWEYPYSQIALDKADISWRTKMDTIAVHTQAPFLLVKDDTKYWGGIYRHGLVVAVSGFQPHFDHAIAETIAALCLGLCRDALGKVPDSEKLQLGED